MNKDLRNYVSMSAHGGVMLGPDVVCDGFVQGAPVRVQSHIHQDHMVGFESSKGYQKVYLSHPSKDLLIAEFNADLPYRRNVIGVDLNTSVEVDNSSLLIQSSGHMLGAVQVQVTMPDSVRVTYSGDFAWPLESVLEADVLVLDSTYGDPDNLRQYSQKDVDDQFQQMVCESLVDGSVHIKTFRGTLQRAMELLNGLGNVPQVAAANQCREIAVYRNHGYSIGDVIDVASDEGKAVISEGRYIRLYSKGDGDLYGLDRGVGISLSAYMTSKTDPVLRFSENSYRVAMTNHADFEGTMAFAETAKPSLVLTDNSRHGSAVILAQEITRRLGIEAKSLEPASNKSWGV